MQLILVAEDEFGNAEILRLLLESSGYRVALAPDGKAALELLRGEKPALILSDFMMPRMNGAELGEAIRSDVALRDIPFVFISATDESFVRKLFRSYDGFVRKPYNFEALLPLVERYIADGRPQRKGPASTEAPEQEFLKGFGISPKD